MILTHLKSPALNILLYLNPPYCLKLNGTHKLLVYADDVNILGGNVHAVKKHTAALFSVVRGLV
jgi:hypothetical protein